MSSERQKMLAGEMCDPFDQELVAARERARDLCQALNSTREGRPLLRADRAAVEAGASEEVRGAAAVADTFKGRARVALPALVNGAVGAVWAPGGRPRVVFGFTIRRGKIVAIDLFADPERLRQLDLVVLED